jgi:hypothetical protein
MRLLSSRKDDSEPLQYVGTRDGIWWMPAVVTQLSVFLVFSLILVNTGLASLKLRVCLWISEY